MAGWAATATAPPRSAAGSSPLPWRTPASFCGLTRPPLLKVVVLMPLEILMPWSSSWCFMNASSIYSWFPVAKPLPCLPRRFAPASRRKCAAAAGHGRQGPRASQYQFDDDEPLWLAVVRDLAAGLRSLVGFLAEQPMQLKHLEWPGFGNTLRTATLTLVLVAVFIVALSSVDAALSCILSWLLRKSA